MVVGHLEAMDHWVMVLGFYLQQMPFKLGSRDPSQQPVVSDYSDYTQFWTATDLLKWTAAHRRILPGALMLQAPRSWRRLFGRCANEYHRWLPPAMEGIPVKAINVNVGRSSRIIPMQFEHKRSPLVSGQGRQ